MSDFHYTTPDGEKLHLRWPEHELQPGEAPAFIIIQNCGKCGVEFDIDNVKVEKRFMRKPLTRHYCPNCGFNYKTT